MTQDIAIVGAGLGGLVTALALVQKGHAVTVYEQAEELGDVGAGISLTPNASKILESLGLRAFLEAEAQQPPANYTRHYQTYDLLVDIQRGDCRAEYGAPYYMIHRAELHSALVNAVDAIAPGAIRTGYGVEDVKIEDGRARLAFSNGESVESSLVIAADGLRSTVRKQLFDPQPPHYLGQIAYRGLVPTDQVSDKWHDIASNNLIGPGAVFVNYYVRGGDLINFVGLAKCEDWVDEGWSTPASQDEILDRYAGWHESVEEIVRAAPASALRKWGLFGHRPLKTFINGPVVLVGDAAHPMLPFFGQGAAMAMEDGLILARCLTDISKRDTALARYEGLRMERDHMVQSESEQGGLRLQSADPDKMTRVNLRNEDSLGIFHYDATSVAI